MAYDKKTFLRNVIILCDTGEQKNEHIKNGFDAIHVKHKDVNLDFGDYSFIVQDRDFSLSCVIERKANINELYGNLTKDRERIEREFGLGSKIANEFTLLIENCASPEYLNGYTVPDWEMKKFNRKIQNIGEHCYATIQSWQCGNKYKFHTIYVADKNDTAIKIVERFYWFWRNYKILSANRRSMRRAT